MLLKAIEARQKYNFIFQVLQKSPVNLEFYIKENYIF